MKEKRRTKKFIKKKKRTDRKGWGLKDYIPRGWGGGGKRLILLGKNPQGGVKRVWGEEERASPLSLDWARKTVVLPRKGGKKKKKKKTGLRKGKKSSLLAAVVERGGLGK